MWEDELKKQKIVMSSYIDKQETGEYQIFTRKDVIAIKDVIPIIHSLLKQQRENCRLAYYKERGYNLPSSTRFPEGVESIIGNVILNASELAGEKK